MKPVLLVAIALLLAAQTATAATDPQIEGRPTILAWRVASGSVDGVPLTGLTVMAAVAEDADNTDDMAGEGNAGVKAIVAVDPRATPAQRDALVGLVRELSGGLIAEVVVVESAPVRFATRLKYVDVNVPDALFDGEPKR